jgi:hypothetical protein
MEGHPEISVSSKNQQFEPPQLMAQAWTPIHSKWGKSNLTHRLSGNLAT